MNPDTAQLDKKKPREILELKVKEVSLVDKPAILREFVVVKRQQEENMGAFTADPENVETKDDVIEKMNWKDIDVEKALPLDLRNAINAVMPWMKKNAGMEGAPKNEINRVAAFLGKVVGGKYPEPASKSEETDDEKKKKEQAAKAVAEGKCPKCGAELKDGACTKCDFKVAAEDGNTPEGKKPEEEEKQKSLTISVSPEGEVQISGQPLAKGKSQFTTDRTDALKSSVGQLITMLASVDKDAAKGIIDELTKTVLPANVKWTSGTIATPASVKKSVEEGVSAALEPITKGFNELKEKVEKMENARPAPQSDGGDGEQTPVQKKDNIWDGLGL